MSFFLNPILACDYYKVGHPFMQPPDTLSVYSTWTARSYKHHPDCPKTVVFGYQYTIQRFLIEFFNENFFNVPIEILREEYGTMIGSTFNPIYSDFSRFEELHELGYLPIRIFGVPEGTLLPAGIPDHTIMNTNPRFAWLPQYLEDIWSANNWMPSTSATTAYYRRKLLRPYFELMTENPFEKTMHSCGDFSMRGHTSLDSAIISGAGHLMAFDRTATIGANTLLQKYYNADLTSAETAPGLGTPSLEHSVVEQGIAWMKNRILDGSIPDYCRPYMRIVAKENWELNLIAEMCFILYLIKDIQPTGVMTYVADTYDYFGVLSKILPVIKEEIAHRPGCFTLRPDSGDPYKIIAGDPNADIGTPEQLGSLRMLCEIFGCKANAKGYMVLPNYIRLIYGDAITPEITRKVGDWCLGTNISIENVIFGIGAYTYQYVTRDTRGYAIKATWCDHKKYGNTQLYKQPKTDPGKKSPRGCVAVVYGPDGEYMMVDGLDVDEAIQYPGNIMVEKFYNGNMEYLEDFDTIRTRLTNEELRDASREEF